MNFKRLAAHLKVDALKSHFNFKYLESPTIGDNGRLKFKTKKGQHKFIIYAISIDNELVYIGKTKDFWKRTDTYKNSKYWKNSFKSNRQKTQLLEHAVKSGKKVDFYYRECKVLSDLNETGEVKVSTMDEEEPRLIQAFKPSWNVQHNRRKKK